MIWYAVINLFVFAIVGIVVYRFGKKCLEEHDSLVSQAEYFVAEPLGRWKVGRLFFILGILQLLAMMLLVRAEMFAFFSPIVTLTEWGIACGVWKRYRTIVIYVKEGRVFFFEKRKWHSESLAQLGGIVAWDGYIAFTVVDDQNQRVFDVFARYENAQSFLTRLSEEISEVS